MITWRSFVIDEGQVQRVDVPMADVFQRILNDVTSHLQWSGPAITCDIIVTSDEDLMCNNSGRSGKAELSVPSEFFPSLSDKRKHLHLYALTVKLIDALADELGVEKVTYRRQGPLRE